ERGVFKTTDGGLTWDKVLYVDDKTGVIDMRMSPADPDTLIAATWEHQRDQFDAFFGQVEGDQYGPAKTHAAGTALYKTSDGGKKWKKLAQGLPTAKMGRIGLDWYRKDPSIVYAIIDTENAGKGPPRITALRASGDKGTGGVELKGINPEGPAGKAGLKVGDVIKTINGKATETVQAINDQLRSVQGGEKLMVTVVRDEKTTDVAVTLEERRTPTGRGGGGFGGGGGGGGFAGAGVLGAVGEDAEGGARLQRLFPEGAAEKAGLQEGDLV